MVTGAAYSSGGQLYAWALALWEGSYRKTSSEQRASSEPIKRDAIKYDVVIPVEPGSDGVLVLPWHAGTRPPAPLVVAGQGAVVGLGLGHNGAHIVSAAVEAVCFQLAGGLGDLEASSEQPLEVVVNGGAIEGAPWWRARLAATLARPLRCSSAPETTSRGAVAAALGAELGAHGHWNGHGPLVEAPVGFLEEFGARWAVRKFPGWKKRLPKG